MLNFPDQPKKETNWSPPNERTVINNVTCILPPNLNKCTVHYLLLRNQFEEVQYYLKHLADEMKYVKYYDCEYKDPSDSRLKTSPDVRIKYKLIEERAKILESILQLYPPFLFNDDDYLPNVNIFQEIKEVYLNTNDQISTVIGENGNNIKSIEKQFDVKISLSDVPFTLKSAPNSIYKDSLCRLLIKGNSKENISNCFQYIQNIIRCQGPNNILAQQKEIEDDNKNYNQNEKKNVPPWEVNTVFQTHNLEEEETGENNINSMIHNGKYLEFMNNQSPPGS